MSGSDNPADATQQSAVEAAESNVNPQRRYFLIGAASVTGAVGAGFAAVPFVKSWMPSAKARAAGAPITIDISKLRVGEILGPIPAWRGQPVFVISRSAETIEQLTSGSEGLADPESKNTDQQPEYAVNAWRSKRPEIAVLLGLCTHLGCSPKFYGKVQPEAFDADWKGGFFCPCHGSRFDLAGRVSKGVPAPDNLQVPPYQFESDSLIVIGVDEETG